jgi:hypothetical protein
VGIYLPILRYPPDVGEFLAEGKINLLEAAQLARLSPKRLGVDAREARRVRQETLLLHTQLAASQADLQRRVNALIKPFNSDLGFTHAAADEMIEAGDGRHMFFEQLKHIHRALQIIQYAVADDRLNDCPCSPTRGGRKRGRQNEALGRVAAGSPLKSTRIRYRSLQGTQPYRVYVQQVKAFPPRRRPPLAKMNVHRT